MSKLIKNIVINHDYKRAFIERVPVMDDQALSVPATHMSKANMYIIGLPIIFRLFAPCSITIFFILITLSLSSNSLG